MLKSYFKDLFNRFKNSKIITKLFIFLFIIFEIFILVISFVKVDYKITTPGFLTEAMYMVDVDTKNQRGHILTVSVTEYSDVSLIQYWLAKNEERVVIEEIKQDDLSDEDYNKYGIISKKIAINNAIINAYNAASLVDPSVKLVKEYKGMVVAVVNGSSNTDIFADDIITEINGVKINSKEDFYNEHKEDIISFAKTVQCKNIVISMLPFKCILGKENKFYEFINSLNNKINFSINPLACQEFFECF